MTEAPDHRTPLYVLQKQGSWHAMRSELLNQISFDPGLATEGPRGTELTPVQPQRYCSKALDVTEHASQVPLLTHKVEPCSGKTNLPSVDY